jgi:hypothetical protein
MPYTSNRSPAGFVTPGTIVNGQSARAAVLNNIANNQQWLAVNNTEMMTVFMGERTNASMRFSVRLNPYATWVEFFVLCLKDVPANSTSQAGLTITCGADTTLFVDIPYGEDYTTTGGTIENEHFGWVSFTGRVDDPTFGIGARALRADATPVNYYTTAECEITIASTVYVKTVCYRVLPGVAPYDVP